MRLTCILLSPSSRLGAVAALALALTGCDLLGLGDGYDNLGPGTFRLHADGQEQSGEATLETRLAPPFGEHSEATVFLSTSTGSVMYLESDDFLTAEPGDRFEAFAGYDQTFVSQSGEVEILSVSASGIEGRFRFRLREVLIGGPFAGGTITVKGGFHASRLEN